MARLYTIDASGEIVKTEKKPFESEIDELEPFIKKNPQIVEDLVIFGRQVMSAGRDKIIDLLAVNKDGEVVILELKKNIVGVDILSQVLRYRAFWKKSLEAVRNLWNQYNAKPEDIEPDWKNYDPKIMIIAPGFDKELIEASGINELPIEFLEISRYKHGNSIFIVVDKLEPPEISMKPTTTMKEYNWDWYAKEVADQRQLEIARGLYDQILKLYEKNNWKLTPKFNKWYLSFKYGYNNVVSLEFRHRGKVSICLVPLKDPKDDPSNRSPLRWNWDKTWNYWYVEIDSPSFDLDKISGLIAEAYKNTVSI